ncbi:UDP-2,4-diacetamido-2,4,6-trideoxy-beta-L-altropyranose hydrolase [Subsaximicrobium wynnwilliamsii]|uniref:UDP-2,4-diacetamido-2,4, 6-trideoxy-beta-L-altropyranose hydrolase n=1 Tax=Subsaximicrobium wynnwilliamsii TaxID=291179 RepID=A0A5C6ZHU5_9FLAO|nr:UDP-2,4-diacetamido-2,4,6-trideoxy-beta-L-altropyranose hydrolase [Subsaximicrobium wynnwilliamsii]TXD83958.1 UDP-2,4-diacetamido-2,4,6-trideoxy-beta-L-altropyranose hydrolase [Subsaximicrobium wynnwilliamsii]TXD89698.1 UDP-2,4-diacetamido-2,4,6-trideoxy-beta-L-altropyranose hydrolase [Subsaximicrobium wynnwilliamsii]TXE01683.1 UDP-2,4-diacetamido-2,4,6-trideoxy-beta-L-altropyranose hydrolase [Subsaximicrobium wynnwilliamsii]
MTKKIIFRADGNGETGLGHLYRLFSLVETVRDHYEFVFLTKASSTHSVIPESYNLGVIPENSSLSEEANWLSENFSAENHIIIADGYQFNAAYQKAIKSKGYKLVYIDDLASEHMYADVVVNHSPNIAQSNYKCETYTNFALGTKYALLRPIFLKLAKQSRSIEKIDTAFVCFGGADLFDLTGKATKALLGMSLFTIVHVVLGAAYQHENILMLKESHPDRLKIHKNLSAEALAKVMQSCNFAIAPSSTILYELSCIKMLILSGYYVDNQELIYKGFLCKKAIFKGGNMTNYQESDFSELMHSILNSGQFEEQIRAQQNMFDDQIASRHLKLIGPLCCE